VLIAKPSQSVVRHSGAARSAEFGIHNSCAAIACYVYLPAGKKHGPLYHGGVLSERISLFVH